MRRPHLAIILIVLKLSLISGSFKFRNIECTSRNTKFVIFEECRIKAFNRTNNVLNIVMNIKDNLKNLSVAFQFYKRERGGWHPFLYGMTLDICKFFDSPHRHPLPSVMYYYLKDYTNVNHSCPYLANTDMKLLDFALDEMGITSKFPIDVGEYAIQSLWYTKKSLIANINSSANYIR